MSEDLHDSINNFHKWQNDPGEVHRAKIKAAQRRLLEHHYAVAKALDPSVLVLTNFDKKLLKGMRIAA